ncbi:hypothetical protein J2W59_001682 [Pseudomonas fluorescens]|nr:hypothetical protein [Pseudomonas fluorescens]
MRTNPRLMWERACSRIQQHIQHHRKLPHRFREQARSHRGFVVDTGLADQPKTKCGSGLAREYSGTFNITASCSTAFASKPAPTGDLWWIPVLRTNPRLRWERACSRIQQHLQHQCKLLHRFREQARSHRGFVVDTGLADQLKTNVGAGLLANTAAHSTSLQAAPPLSRASPLPQWICGEHQSCDRPRSPVGASLLAMAASHSTKMLKLLATGVDSAANDPLQTRLAHHNCPQTHRNTGTAPTPGASRKVC